METLSSEQDARDGSGAQPAPFRVRLRRLGEVLAACRQQSRRLWHSLLAASLSVFLVPPAQARTYDVLTAEVPFQFTVGERTFRSGIYQFIFVGNGLLALRDAYNRVIALLITRPVDSNEPSPTSRLIFKTQKRHNRLARILIENRLQSLEIVGEEVAVRSTPPPSPSLPFGALSFGERMDGPHLKQ